VSRFGSACLAALAIALVTPVSSQAASGTFDRAWGKGVNGGSVFGVCTVATNCLAGGSGSLGGELNAPIGVATDPSGNVYVVDASNNRIQKFNSSGVWERAWGANVNGGGVFGVCTVASSCNAGNAGSSAGALSFPWGIAADQSGNVYVSEITNNRVQKYDSSGTFLMAWGKDVVSSGSGNNGTEFEVCVAGTGAVCKQGVAGGKGGEFNVPTGISVDGAGNVYVSETTGQRVQKFSSTGVWDRAWGKSVHTTAPLNVCGIASECQSGITGGLGGEFAFAQGVATDASGNVYVADTNNYRVQKFDSSGNFQRAWGNGVMGGGSFEICVVATSCTSGNFSGGLGGTMSGAELIAAEPNGAVYVGESSNYRVQRFDSSGNFQRLWGKDVVVSGPGDAGTTGFEICVAANGDVCQQGDPGSLGGEFVIPRGIAADTAGNVYVADNGNQRIQRFADPVSSPPPGPGSAPPSTSPGATGQRAAALKKCKKKRGAARAKCKKKAKRLPL
jgi:tripartite motif-containing protein 71